MKTSFRLQLAAFVAIVIALSGCGGSVAPIPSSPVGRADSSADARATLQACLQAHGGKPAYDRLHDVNVRFDSHWSSIGPKLQPKLSDTGFRQGSEERYLSGGTRAGWIVGQAHHGSKGDKFVARTSTNVAIFYNGTPSSDTEAKAAASLVTDAYSLFVFGPDFIVRRGAALRKLETTSDVDGNVCEQVLAVLRPGLGQSAEDRVVLSIDLQNHHLRRVSFTLNALELTRGAEVHVDLSRHRKLAGVLFPTQFYEHIDRPVNLDAHRWQLLGFDVNRGYTTTDLTGPAFKGAAAKPAAAYRESAE